MGVKIRQIRNKLYLVICKNGKRKTESLGISIPDNKELRKEAYELAEYCRAKRELQIASKEWGYIDNSKTRLADYMREIGKARSQTHRLNLCVKKLEKYPDGDLPIQAVSEQWLLNFQKYLLQDCGVNATTAAEYYQAIKQTLNQAARERLIQTSPAGNVKSLSAPESKKVFLSLDELERLSRTAVNGRLGAECRRAFLFSCFTGLRVSDLKTLEWEDIDRVSRQVIKAQKKTKDFVYIPMSGTAWALIDDGAIHRFDEPVFPVLAGAKSNNQSEMLNKWAAEAGVEKRLGWHTARHTFAVLSLEAGAELYTVSKLLGHTDIKTTQVYAKVTDKLKRAAVDALPKIDIAGY